jgi:AcrR family transcriptional regulator
VAKASLYNTFGSKVELVRAYLEGRHAQTAERITRYLERYSDPRDRLLGVFEAQGELFAAPGFRGCAFVSASAESPGEMVEQDASDYRSWVRLPLVDLAREAGALIATETLGRQLHASLRRRVAVGPDGSRPVRVRRRAGGGRGPPGRRARLTARTGPWWGSSRAAGRGRVIVLR